MKNIRESFVDAARQWQMNKAAGKAELLNEATGLLRVIKQLQSDLGAVKSALESAIQFRAAVFLVVTGETNSERLHRDIIALQTAFSALQNSFAVFVNNLNANIKPDGAFSELSSLSKWIGKYATEGAENAALEVWALSAEVVKYQRELEAHMGSHDRVDATGDFSATIAWRNERDRIESEINAEKEKSEHNAKALSDILSPHPEVIALGINTISEALEQVADALENLMMKLWEETTDERACSNLINFCYRRIYQNKSLL